MSCCLGVDVGGTKVLGAVVDDDGQIVHRVQRPTDKNSGNESMFEVVDETLQSSPHSVDAIGLAIAGFIETSTGHIVFAPNLRGIDHDIRGSIARRFGLPVVIENDANAAAWAEARFGAGRGADNLLMLTIGTGIGGGIVIDGELYRGSRGFAGEFGHMVAVVDGDLCACGRRGCLEAIASGTALGKLARQGAADHPESAVLQKARGDPEKITGALVGEALKEGDRFAAELFAELAERLAMGLAGLAHAFDPEMIVLGGGVSKAGDALLGPATEALSRRFEDQRPAPPLVAAKLGNDAGVIGVASLASRHSHKKT